ncbi:hypothetical protein T484DRAFT_1842034 [Baffinella frigidus]|nr:hypothetical protein T484DRAFT_1842034 [Cryptophyta sp. CCMP2293]
MDDGDASMEEVRIADETIPCISDYGSCTYDLCSCIDHVFGETCDPWFAAHGLDCHCPFKPMNLTATKATFNLPAAGNVPGWLVDGDLQVL